MKKSLVRNGRHQSPMLAVLERYGIGSADQYDRGRWITEADLPRIQAGMASDPSRQELYFNGQTYPFVRGTNMHNSVMFKDFQELFS